MAVVRFAANEQAETTFAMLAECFEALGGVPKVVLADRMGCLKGAEVAQSSRLWRGRGGCRQGDRGRPSSRRR